jgi:hypothetical protein
MHKRSPRGSGRRGTSFHLDGKLTRTSCCRFNNRVIEANAEIPSRFCAVCFDMINWFDAHVPHVVQKEASFFLDQSGRRQICLLGSLDLQPCAPHAGLEALRELGDLCHSATL